MKFTCTKDNLIKGLSSVSGLTNKNIALPILNNVLISASGDGIQLSATNLEIGIQKNIRGKIEKQGKITLPARVLLSFINLLPEEKVDFELMENNEMLVKSGTWQTKIKTQSADEYPLIPEVEKKNEFKISVGKLKNGLAQTTFAAMNNESRPELSGGLFKLKENLFILVATDSYRLAEKKIEIDTKIKKETQFIVPIKTLQELLRLINDVDNNLEVQIGWEENQIMFKIDDLILTSRLIDGDYPDYEQIIPENSKTSVKFLKSEIVNAIKASALFSKTGIFDVNFEFKTPDKIILKSSNTQLGENTAEISAEVKGENNNIVFNYHYVLDGLNNIPGQNLILELTNANNPAVLRSEGEGDYLYLVMSIRQ